VRDNPPTKRAGGVFIGRLFGIEFYLDYSWFLIAGLVTYILSTKFFPFLAPGFESSTYLLMGVSAAVLFFVSILLHELGHSIVSQRCGIPVPRITLLFIGGVAEISREPDDAKSELKIALAGPAVTVALIVIYAAIAMACNAAGAVALGVIFSWLARVNLALVIFNAIPGYPLDGGRVLRALLWARNKNFRQATYVTSRIGIGFSWILMILGVLLLFGREWNGFVLLLIGLFLRTAAESGYMNAVYREVLSGVTVADIMSRDPICIPSRTPVNLAVDEYFLTNHHVAFPVCEDDGEFRGVIRLDHLKSLPKEQWPYTSAGDLAAANNGASLCISGEEQAGTAMRRLLVPPEGRLAVVDAANKVRGMVTRHDILQFIRIHTALNE
jgi:Zn-dependent protease